MKQLWQSLQDKEAPIGIVGLGYVGLPLACLLANKFKVVGFDINSRRIDELKSGKDLTNEVESRDQLLNANLSYTDQASALNECPLVIVAVPTPIDHFKKPDLRPVISASRTVGQNLRPGAVVVFESTVYPGVTEDICLGEIEQQSGLKHLEGFYLGYSPERVNPGDKLHTIDKIVKVVSGCTPEVCDLLADVYGSVITAGIHKAATIKTAEAAKVIENTQRDLNIALINELAMIFNRVGLDTTDVLEAAGTKWNFLKFQPGLVGGHCIGVDPYYLTYMAEGMNLHPQVISAGRRINDGMSSFVAQETLKHILAKQESRDQKIRVAVMGVTFKENVPDLRNTKVVDLIRELEEHGVEVFAFDPVAQSHEYHEEYGRKLSTWDQIPACDAMILAVKHQAFAEEFPLNRLKDKLHGQPLIMDLKGMIDRHQAQEAGVKLWRL